MCPWGAALLSQQEAQRSGSCKHPCPVGDDSRPFRGPTSLDVFTPCRSPTRGRRPPCPRLRVPGRALCLLQGPPCISQTLGLPENLDFPEEGPGPLAALSLSGGPSVRRSSSQAGGCARVCALAAERSELVFRPFVGPWRSGPFILAVLGCQDPEIRSRGRRVQPGTRGSEAGVTRSLDPPPPIYSAHRLQRNRSYGFPGTLGSAEKSWPRAPRASGNNAGRSGRPAPAGGRPAGSSAETPGKRSSQGKRMPFIKREPSQPVSSPPLLPLLSYRK